MPSECACLPMKPGNESGDRRDACPTPTFATDLAARLDALRQQGLHRELRRVESAQGPHMECGGRMLLNFSSNDYLGLANHPALKSAAVEAIGRYGAGSGSARLICGSLAPHHELEEALADFKGTAAALTFSSGYATAVGTIGALLGRGRRHNFGQARPRLHRGRGPTVWRETPRFRAQRPQ